MGTIIASGTPSTSYVYDKDIFVYFPQLGYGRLITGQMMNVIYDSVIPSIKVKYNI